MPTATASPDPNSDLESSVSDSDFAPEPAPPHADAHARRSSSASASASSTSSSDAEVAPARPDRRRRRSKNGRTAPASLPQPDLGLDNSGDEVVLATGRKSRLRKPGRRSASPVEARGPIQTRSVRAAEKANRRFTAALGPVTVDVDVLWAQMKSGAAPATTRPDPAPPADDDAMVRIQRTYNFAGRVHAEEKLVLRDSAEAQLHLSAGAPPAPAPPRQPLRRAFRSAFEPPPPPSTRADLDLGIPARERARQTTAAAEARRINTVEKSRIDWSGFVDREGLRHDLDVAGRAKDAYAHREAFLGRSDARIEQTRRAHARGTAAAGATT